MGSITQSEMEYVLCIWFFQQCNLTEQFVFARHGHNTTVVVCILQFITYPMPNWLHTEIPLVDEKPGLSIYHKPGSDFVRGYQECMSLHLRTFQERQQSFLIQFCAMEIKDYHLSFQACGIYNCGHTNITMQKRCWDIQHQSTSLPCSSRALQP